MKQNQVKGVIKLVNDIPSNIVAVVGIIVLGILGAFICHMGVDTILLETVIIVISGLSGYKLKDTVDKKKIEELTQVIETLRNDKN